MPRRIRTITLQSTDGGDPPDGFFDRVIKYIPADVVGGWVAATGVIASIGEADSSSGTVFWLAFAAGLALTAAWTYVQTTEPNKPPAVKQTVIATIAFFVWVFALGGPFASLAWYQQYQGSLLLIGFTLAAGLFVPKT